MKAKKMIAFVLAMAMLLTMTVPAMAELNPGNYSKTSKMYHSGSYSTTSFNANLSWPNLTNKVKWSGTSQTVWYGSSPFYADSIKHTNTVTVSGIGALSITSSSVGGTISGSQMNDEMSVSNAWKLTSNFSYSLKRGVFITGSDFATSGRVQIGTSFYSMTCST